MSSPPGEGDHSNPARAGRDARDSASWAGAALAVLGFLAAVVLIASCGANSTINVDAAPAVESSATATPGDEPPPPSPTPTVTPTPTPTPTPTVTPTPTPIPPPWVPTPGTTWQWQLSGEIVTDVEVEMYDIDLFDAPVELIAGLQAEGRKVICYFSAGSFEEWRPDADRFAPSLLGDGNGWPGEWWLDIRDIRALGPIMEARLDLAVEKGCDGVEPDNIDAFQNDSGFDISATDQIGYARWLSIQARSRGLSIGMKNAIALVPELEPSFDWALNERCFEFNECALLTPFIEAGKAVFHVEYQGDLSWCPRALELGFSSLEKDRLVGPEYRPCIPEG